VRQSTKALRIHFAERVLLFAKQRLNFVKMSRKRLKKPSISGSFAFAKVK